MESDGLGVRALLDPTAAENSYWSQSLLILDTERELRELVVEVRVSTERDASPTGNWSTLPADEWETTVAREGDALVYRWRLREGAAVPAGEHTFAAQYAHPEGSRGAGADRFTVRGVTGDGAEVSARGGFA
ncbi:hypothetical protein FOE67_13620 [Streptomyces calidiresistens]|uniref:Uncharacterized protein n=1 Tax=Streptomyces calidiresistens TaxID=1485586 RepID=A0A7W3T401_9ACTN|nr:hypothetical protein [Streptomyces calidiresistens]